MGDWMEDVIHYKYDPLPDEPRHRKKARKVHVRSDHKHVYEDVCIDAHEVIYRDGKCLHVYSIGERCEVCGRLSNVRMARLLEPADGLPLYQVVDYAALLYMKVLPDEMRVDA